MLEIYGTLGPSCGQEETLKQMLELGMTGVRLNLSHVTLAQAEPMVEALQRGTPVLAADMPVFREVGEGYCIWFPQDDAQALADRVRFYEQHPDDYKDLKQSLASYRGHTWEEAYTGIRREL